VPFGTIEKGKEYPIIGVAGNWYKIDYVGRIGYVYAPAARLTFASGDRYFKVVENNVSVYDNSSGQLVKVGSLTKGQVYPIVSIVGNWHRIKFGNGYGYVWKDATEPDNGNGLKNLNDGVKNSRTGFTALATLSVYDNTSGKLVPFGMIDSGVTYPYIGKLGDWYKIDYAGRIGYVYAPATEETTTYSYYNLTLSEMLEIQMAAGPKTDIVNHAYVHSSYIELMDNGASGKVVVKDNVLNVRTTPAINGEANKCGQLNNGDIVQIIGKVGDWYKIKYSKWCGDWKEADREDVLYFLNPNNFLNLNDPTIFQFLKLTRYTGLTADEINNKILTNDKGILAGKGEAFVTAAQKYNINEIYLIAHALHETGNGKSTLATGVKIKDEKGVEYTVYNMYGIGAKDTCPIQCGAEYALQKGWTTPEKAIIGGAAFIGEGYIHNGQDTLYKMRWNPDNPGTHQYATNIRWALLQANSYISKYYSMLDKYILYLDIPVFK
ncbi:N-acetylglucosaminidase, partial [Bacillus alveayuensis]|uniref:N-acetylglucosaminidase n=1 Tax=Aeribacillus alveayuensis TaxID=279215 RepID=UPI0005D1292C